MKKLIIIMALTMASLVTYGQGVVKWQNSGSFPITTNGVNLAPRTTGNTNTYFGGALLVSTNGSPFTVAAVATNSASLSGVISAGTSTAMPFSGAFSYRVVVWSFALGGLDYNAVLNNLVFDQALYTDTTPQTTSAALAGTWFGFSTIGNASTATVPATPTDLWGASPLIQGFGLNLVTLVPEPSTFALAGLGIAALVAFRRRKV